MTKFNPEIHHRKSIRLPGYDYSAAGSYFITICLRDIRCMLARWHNGRLQLTEIGKIAERHWREIPEHFQHALIDEFVIMPDHLHGIIHITAADGSNDSNNRGAEGAGHVLPLQSTQCRHEFHRIIPGSIGSIVRSYKSSVKRWCNRSGFPQFTWQRNYYEHIVRNDGELEVIRRYIRSNPRQFQTAFPGLFQKTGCMPK